MKKIKSFFSKLWITLKKFDWKKPLTVFIVLYLVFTMFFTSFYLIRNSHHQSNVDIALAEEPPEPFLRDSLVFHSVGDSSGNNTIYPFMLCTYLDQEYGAFLYPVYNTALGRYSYAWETIEEYNTVTLNGRSCCQVTFNDLTCSYCFNRIIYSLTFSVTITTSANRFRFDSFDCRYYSIDYMNKIYKWSNPNNTEFTQIQFSFSGSPRIITGVAQVTFDNSFAFLLGGLSSSVIPYENGYYDGYRNGYSVGDYDGYLRGLNASLEDYTPMSAFKDNVSELMDTKILGDISFGMLISIGFGLILLGLALKLLM